jgi:hypothetical protein
VLAMFDPHYQGLDRTALGGDWAPGISDAHCDQLEEDCADFARDMADSSMKDLNLLSRDAPKDPERSRPSS